MQQSLPLPCRWGEHVSRGLAQWLRSYFLVGGNSTQIGESGGHSDPCPSLLDGALRSGPPPNKERGNCAWGGVGHYWMRSRSLSTITQPWIS
jgi:hypothetical protein